MGKILYMELKWLKKIQIRQKEIKKKILYYYF